MHNLLLFVEANTTGTGMLAIERARSLGLRPLFLTNNPQRYRGLEKSGCPLLICDTNSCTAIADAVGTKILRGHVCGVTTTSDFYLETVADLAAAYNLPGNPPEAVRSCRNKVQTRLRLEEAQVKQPGFAIVRSPSDVDKGLEALDLPCVVKPADESGSNEVRLCLTTAEVEAQASRILDMHTNARGQPAAHTVLIEEFLDAPEFSVEAFAWKGTTTCVGITDKVVTGFPYFVEQRHIFPAYLSLDVSREIISTVGRALKAVGVTTGATHTEVKVTPEGCAIVEINARLAGGMIPALIQYAAGVALLDQQIRAVVGVPPDLKASHYGCAGIYFLMAQADGVLNCVRGIEAAEAADGVEQVTITASPGSRVSTPRNAYDRLGYVIARADTAEAVAARLQVAIAKLEIVVGPDPAQEVVMRDIL